MSRLFLCALVLFSLHLEAETIQFPQEELANESVLPVFDRPQAVKNRRVNVAERFEVGLVGGADLSEPFFGPFSFGGSLAYNFGETQGLYFSFNSSLKQDSTFKKQLESDTNTNLDGAPRVEYLLLANYQYAPFYGKMSITKQTVTNFHLFFTAGGGLAAMGGQMNPVVSLGLGQKFYFSPRWALRFDLRGLVLTGPDPLSVAMPEGGPVPEISEFKKRLFINTFLTAALVVVL